MGDCGGGVSLPSSSQSVEAVIGANAWAGKVPKHASVLHAESQGLDGVANVLQLEAIRRLRWGGGDDDITHTRHIIITIIANGFWTEIDFGKKGDGLL